MPGDAGGAGGECAGADQGAAALADLADGGPGPEHQPVQPGALHQPLAPLPRHALPPCQGQDVSTPSTQHPVSREIATLYFLPCFNSIIKIIKMIKLLV